jgi:hypothetical protein
MERVIVAKKKITQSVLAKIAKQKALIEKLQDEVKLAESTVLANLKSGSVVVPGLLTAYVHTWERRSPSWKGVVERELGADYAARVLAGTKADKFENLKIELA